MNDVAPDPASAPGGANQQESPSVKADKASKRLQAKAAYVWRAGPFLDAETRGSALARLKEENFDRILLSFDAREIQTLRTREGAALLNDLLKTASQSGIVVDLLLGDPAWITPEARGELEALLTFFASCPFRAVHLDLEPDMLPGAGEMRDLLLAQLIDTLKMATVTAGRPVGISIHPRYLEGSLGRKAASAFARMGLAEIAVMIYSTDADAVADRFGKICRAWPALRFALAQSVERDLPRTESYFSAGTAIFDRRMQALSSGIRNANFVALIVQSWENYTAMEQ